MIHPLLRFLLVVLLALVASPLVTVLTRSANFSALILFPLLLVIGWLARLNKTVLGLRWGLPQDYVLAVLYPLVVMGVLILGIWLVEGIQLQNFSPTQSLLFVVVNATAGILIGLLTEEGYFRGVLWGIGRRAGYSAKMTLFATSVAFFLWHIPVMLLEFDTQPSLITALFFLGNVLFLGLNWGLMRLASGSVIVPSVSHAVWNAFAYELFGFGDGFGLLLRETVTIFDPERGFVGLFLNILAFFFLFARLSKLAWVSEHLKNT